MSGNITESKRFQNISATTANFVLLGGRYGISAIATWNAGSVALYTLGPDGVTMIPTGTVLSADGYTTVDIPPGQYQFVIAAATGVYLTITSVPF